MLLCIFVIIQLLRNNTFLALLTAQSLICLTSAPTATLETPVIFILLIWGHLTVGALAKATVVVIQHYRNETELKFEVN